ncbi:hypothetical protein GA0061093_1616 [Rhodococcus qingshengii]|nr:hypothetical protein GA0061093_11743 [Rhodococcus qingshengii]SCC70619.1 hypothetical protein GA0061093_1616 [Rhodococcus qingshengii]
MVVEVSLDPPHIMGRKWPAKHAGWLRVSGIVCATFLSASSLLETVMDGVRRDVVTRLQAGGSLIVCLAPELGALDPPGWY